MQRSTFRVLTPDRSDSDIASGHDNLGDQELQGWRVVGMAEGGLWTTAKELTKVVIAIQQSYLGRGGFLSHKTVDQMLTRQNERWGLGVEVDGAGDNLRFQHD
jgi:hypothetical protein